MNVKLEKTYERIEINTLDENVVSSLRDQNFPNRKAIIAGLLVFQND